MSAADVDIGAKPVTPPQQVGVGPVFPVDTRAKNTNVGTAGSTQGLYVEQTERKRGGGSTKTFL